MLQTFNHLADEELARGVQQGNLYLFGLLVERYEDDSPRSKLRGIIKLIYARPYRYQALIHSP